MLKNILVFYLLLSTTKLVEVDISNTFGDQTLILHCHLSNVQNWLMTFYCFDRFVGILTMACYNPYITRYNPLYIQETSRVSVTAHFKTWASTGKATICPGKKEPKEDWSPWSPSWNFKNVWKWLISLRDGHPTPNLLESSQLSQLTPTGQVSNFMERVVDHLSGQRNTRNGTRVVTRVCLKIAMARGCCCCCCSV